jgi:phage head maturation protease
MALKIIGTDDDVKRYVEILKSRGIIAKGTLNEQIYKERPEGFRMLSGSIMQCSYNKDYVASKTKMKADPDAKLYIKDIANARIIDRMDEIVEPAGGDFKHFMNAPMLLSDHSYRCEYAIGQVISIMPEFDGLHFEAWIGDPMNGPLTDKQKELRSLVSQGILRTVSIGFIPTEVKAPTWDDQDRLLTPALINKWEMLELSVVPVPANAGSLFDMRQVDNNLSNETQTEEEKTLTDNTNNIDNDTKADTTTVQSLIFDKKLFTVEQAKKWAHDHDFRNDKVDETTDSIRLRQKDPNDFIEGSFRTIELTKGVKAVIGRLKDGLEMEKKLDELIETMKTLGQSVENLGIKIDKSVEVSTSILGFVEEKKKPCGDENKDEKDTKPDKPCDTDETKKQMDSMSAEIAEIKNVLKLIIEKL